MGDRCQGESFKILSLALESSHGHALATTTRHVSRSSTTPRRSGWTNNLKWLCLQMQRQPRLTKTNVQLAFRRQPRERRSTQDAMNVGIAGHHVCGRVSYRRTESRRAGTQSLNQQQGPKTCRSGFQHTRTLNIRALRSTADLVRRARMLQNAPRWNHR